VDDDARRPKLLYTVKEAAAALGIGRTMLYRLMGTGQLRPVHIGPLTRFTAGELDRFVDHIQQDRPRVHPPLCSARDRV
jgi:excisionase family DNA binding protein